MTTDSDVFWLAAIIIDKGWMRGREEEGGRYSLDGALHIASGTPTDSSLPLSILSELHGALLQFGYYRLLNRIAPSAVTQIELIMAWNDAWWRRKSTILEVLIGLGTTLDSPSLKNISA